MENSSALPNDVVFNRCPLCGQDKVINLGPIQYKEPLLFSSTRISLAHSPFLSKCRNCKSSFTQNILSEENARQLYSGGSAAERWDTSSIESAKTRKVIQELDKLFQPGAKVLDIGANTGTILDYAASKGCSTFAIEYSRLSREFLAQRGHKAYASMDETNDQYDVICAFDLIEHIYDVPNFLGSIHSLLDNQGKFVVLTGDPNSLSASVAKNNWWYAKAPEHIVFPSHQYLSTVKGFRTRSIAKTYASPGYEHSPAASAISFMKGFIKGNYNGRPSLGADHYLITMEKDSARSHTD